MFVDRVPQFGWALAEAETILSSLRHQWDSVLVGLSIFRVSR